MFRYSLPTESVGNRLKFDVCPQNRRKTLLLGQVKNGLTVLREMA